MIEKRNKFRAQKEALKADKEKADQLYVNDSNQSTNSFSASSPSTSTSSSPSASYTSSPCRTPAPSSPLSNASTSPTHGQDNQAESTPICNTLSQAALAIQAPVASGHIIKTIDRVFNNFPNSYSLNSVFPAIQNLCFC